MKVQICFRGFQSVFRWCIWKFRFFSWFSVCFPLIYLKVQFFFVVFSLFSADIFESSDFFRSFQSVFRWYIWKFRFFSWFSVCFPLIYLKVQTFFEVFNLFSADIFESSDSFVVFGLIYLKVQICFRGFQSVFRWYIWKFRFFCSFQSVFRWYVWKFRFFCGFRSNIFESSDLFSWFSVCFPLMYLKVQIFFLVFSLFSADIFESSVFFRSFQSVFRWYIWKFRFFS